MVTNNGNGTVTYNPSLNYNGIDTFTYTIDDGNDGQDTATVTVTINSVNDNPGNPGSITVPDLIKGGNDINVSWVTASNVDTDNIKYSVDFYNGSEWINNVYEGTNTSFIYNNTANINTENSKFRVKAIDDNVEAFESSFVESLEFTIDSLAPKIETELETVGGNVYTNNYVEVTYEINDSLSGIDEVYINDEDNMIWYVDNGTVTEAVYSKVYSYNGSSFSLKYTIEENGEYTFYAKDNAENENEEVILIKNIDKLTPDFEFVYDNSWTNGSVLININAGDEGNSGIKGIYRTVAESVYEVKMPYNITENGAYIFNVEDNAGNLRTKTLQISNIDDVIPTVSIEKTPNTNYTYNEYQIEITAADNLAGIQTIYYRLKGAQVTDGWVGYDGNIIIRNKGFTKITAKAIDNAGNVSAVSETEVLIKKKDSNTIATNATEDIVEQYNNQREEQNDSSDIIISLGDNKGETTQLRIDKVLINDIQSMEDEQDSEGENSKVSINIVLPSGQMLLPIKEVNDKVIENETGIIAEKINVIIKKVGSNQKKIITDEVSKHSQTRMMGEPVEFRVEVEDGQGQKKEVKKFEKLVSRRITIKEESIEEGKTLIAVTIDEETGELIPVPAVFSQKDGEMIVDIKHMGTGTYTVLEVPKVEIKQEHWAKEAVERVASKLMLQDSFKEERDLDSGITRGEIASTITKVLGIIGNGNMEDEYNDIGEDNKFNSAINIATQMGIMNGYGDGDFKPDQVISREEVAVVLNNAIKYLCEELSIEESINEYDDLETVSLWAENSVDRITELNLMKGYPDETFKPGKDISIAEWMLVLNDTAMHFGLLN